jgi:hypothetical protein
MRTALLLTVTAFLPAPARADVAKHATITRNQGGQATGYTEMVADDAGNLRIEIYGVDAAGNRGAMRDFVVFRAAEVMEKMDDYYPILTESNGQLTTLVRTDGQGTADFNPPCN